MHATVAIGKVRRGGNHRCTQSSPFFSIIFVVVSPHTPVVVPPSFHQHQLLACHSHWARFCLHPPWLVQASPDHQFAIWSVGMICIPVSSLSSFPSPEPCLCQLTFGKLLDADHKSSLGLCIGPIIGWFQPEDLVVVSPYYSCACDVMKPVFPNLWENEYHFGKYLVAPDACQAASIAV